MIKTYSDGANGTGILAVVSLVFYDEDEIGMYHTELFIEPEDIPCDMIADALMEFAKAIKEGKFVKEIVEFSDDFVEVERKFTLIKGGKIDAQEEKSE